MRPAILFSLTLAVWGCSQTRQFQPPVNPNTLDETQFLHYLAGVPVVTYDETCRAVVMLLEPENQMSEHAQRESYLLERKMVQGAWDIQPEQIVDMGTLAYMLTRACAIPPSASSVVLGSWGLGDRRYAHRQAVSEGLLDYAPVYKPVAGGDLVMALARADDYLAKQRGGDDAPVDSPNDP